MEKWDLYNRDRTMAGIEHVRGEKIPKGYYHLVVHVWLRNSKGEYLMSQRSADRPTFPLMWECVGGSVVKGEDSLTGAIREAKEEIGVDLPEKGAKLVLSRVRDWFDDIFDVWLWEYDGEVDLEKATTKEVAQVKWMSVDEIRGMFESGEMVQTLGYFFDEVDR